MPKFTPPRWAKRGNFIWQGHSQEPPLFLKRLGAFPARQKLVNEAAHSEKFLKWLGSFGPSAFNTHFYKGHGLVAEAEHQRNLKKLVTLSHKYGIKVNAYTQFGNFMYEDMMNEIAGVEEWSKKKYL